jgi:Fe-S oxidoreductase
MERNANESGRDVEKKDHGGMGTHSSEGSGTGTRNMLEGLKDNPDRRYVRFMKNACVRCGLCAESCHYYLSTGEHDVIPAVKAERVTRFLKKHSRSLRSLLPTKTGNQDLHTQEREGLFKAAFEDCSLCGRCTLSCPLGLSTKKTMYVARSLFAAIGELPAGLDEPVQTAMETGNYIGMSTEDFVENIEWTGEELGEELEVEDLSVPIDKQGAESMYVPHPLEVRDYPLLLMATMKLLYASGEDYTFSSHCFDVTDYAYYQGSRDNTKRIVQRLLEARERIQAKSVVLTPCGHGYRVMRWEAERLLGTKFPFPVYTMVERIDSYLRDGRIQVEKDAVEGPVTYHDPCNIGRLGGVIQEPRRILSALTSRFVEMEPHGIWSHCCGGGGGLSATGDYGQRRIQAGKAKVEQIRRTGAKVVATGCYNCMTQIRELNRAYEMGVEVKSLVELVAESLNM